MRSQHADLPELLIDMRLVAIEQCAQTGDVTVELIEVAALIAAVVLNRLAATRRGPGLGYGRRPGLIDDIDTGYGIPAGELTPAMRQSVLYAALIHLRVKFNIPRQFDHGQRDQQHRTQQ